MVGPGFQGISKRISIFLAEINGYLEEELKRVKRIRYLLKELVRKLIRMAYKVIIYIPKKELKILEKGKDKLKNLVK